MPHRPTVIDLFAGAGGLSASLEATGWRTLATIDNDDSAVATMRANQAKGRLRGATVFHADVCDMSGADLIGAGNRLDLLAGGPPCQPFSSAGKMRALEDPRGRLFHEFVRIAYELKPRFVLFENVAGLVTAKASSGVAGDVLRRVQAEFESIGYACRFDLLNAADYGAAQRRVRLYMVASRDEELPEFPEPTHSRDAAFGQKSWVTLRELLASLPPPDPIDIVKPTGSRSDALLALQPGKGLRSGGIVEANRPSGHWGYRQDCFVAHLDTPGRTIRAATTPDWVPAEHGGLRRLTWRECAALQGFDPEWEIVGPVAARFRQIGNAVQGHIGRAIGKALFEHAASRNPCSPASAPWPASFHRRVRYTAMEEVTNGAHRRAAKERNGQSAPLV